MAQGTFHTIKFLAPFAMMPRAKLLVYTVVNGEFVYDEQVIQFEENLLNAASALQFDLLSLLDYVIFYIGTN